MSTSFAMAIGMRESFSWLWSFTLDHGRLARDANGRSLRIGDSVGFAPVGPDGYDPTVKLWQGVFDLTPSDSFTIKRFLGWEVQAEIFSPKLDFSFTVSTRLLVRLEESNEELDPQELGLGDLDFEGMGLGPDGDDGLAF